MIRINLPSLAGQTPVDIHVFARSAFKGAWKAIPSHVSLEVVRILGLLQQTKGINEISGQNRMSTGVEAFDTFPRDCDDKYWRLTEILVSTLRLLRCTSYPKD